MSRSLSVGIVTYQSDLDAFSRLLKTLAAAVRVAAQELGMGAVVWAVLNDESPQRRQSLAALVRRQAAAAPERLDLQILEGHGNIGYGAGQNLAIRRSRADFHLVLNPDVELEPRALVACARHLEAHPECVLVAPQGFDGAGRYLGLAKREPSLLALALRGLSVRPSAGLLGRQVGRYIYSDRLPSPTPQPIALASGCFMFCRASALQSVGGFDERYFLYFEDYDLSRRLARQGVLCEAPNARIRHHGGRTARRGPRRIFQFVRSAIRYFNRYGWKLC